MPDDLDSLRAALEACHGQQYELDEFVSLLAHDLRTPLTSIRGYAQLLLRQRTGQPPLDPSITSGLTTIVEQSDRLAGLTNLLLDVSRIRLGRVALLRKEVDLGHLARAVIGGWSPAAAAPDLYAPDQQLLVSADATRMQQSLRSLLLYASGRQGALPPYSLALRAEPPDAICRVMGGGEALQPARLRRLFAELVSEGESATTWQLAQPDLFVVRGVIEAHGGSVLASTPATGHGLEMAIRLPLL